MDQTDKRTVAAFGRQWTRYTENDGYYASTDCLSDILGPLLALDEIRGKSVCDIGSGTGRIVNMLLDAGAGHVLAVEPSAAFEVLEHNTRARRDRVTLLHAPGDALQESATRDLVFSIGVIHHIRDPEPTLRAAHRCLKPGGRIVLWVYGWEGNALYLSIFGPLRRLTARLPHRVLSALCTALNGATSLYLAACRHLPLPMRDYMLNHYARLSAEQRKLTIYDQLNPPHSHYYRRAELASLLERTGFTDVRLHHRHGYSWSACAVRPAQGATT